MIAVIYQTKRSAGKADFLEVNNHLPHLEKPKRLKYIGLFNYLKKNV